MLEFFPSNRNHKDGFQSWCRKCYQEHDRKRYHANPEIKLKSGKIWRDTHKEEVQGIQRSWRKNNPDRVKAALERYKQKYPERVKSATVRYREANLAKTRAASRKWAREHKDKKRKYDRNRQKNNPDLVRISHAKRQASVYKADGKHTVADIQQQGNSQNWKCYWNLPGCAIDCSTKYHVDHVIPLSRGGSNWPSNLVIACPHCNTSKGTKLPEELELLRSKPQQL